MRDLVILNSSTVTPPNPTPSHHHTKPKCKPNALNPTKPSSSKQAISTVHSRPPLLTTGRWDLATTTTTSRYKSRLNYYANLASNLAGDGRLDDFLMIAESVLNAGVEPSLFVAALNVGLVSRGICGVLCSGKLEYVAEVLRSVEKLGISILGLFDGSSMEMLSSECRRIMNCGQVELAVELMETLSGFHFPIKKLVKPLDIIEICIDKRKPEMAVRYACILPRAPPLFCTIIEEFGKKRDLKSALAAFETSRHKLSAPNMYAYRTMIDVCGLCGDCIRSRYIYELICDLELNPHFSSGLASAHIVKEGAVFMRNARSFILS